MRTLALFVVVGLGSACGPAALTDAASLWVELLGGDVKARTFGEDVWACPCGGRRKVLAVVTRHRTTEEVLHLGLLTPRRALPPSQGPPQLALPM